MSIALTIAGIILLVLLISVFRLHTFLAFLIVSAGLALALGMAPAKIASAIQTGIGGTLSSIVSIIALGAMLGKMVAISGAAERISTTMVRLFGVKNIRWAFLATGFIVGLPLFYSVGFMLVVPLAVTVAWRNKLPAVFVGLPLLSALSVTQGFLPPHPAPLYLIQQLHADTGKTLLYGIIISIPAMLISGIWFGNTVKNIKTPPNLSFVAPDLPDNQLPSTFLSFATVLLPILLIGSSTAILPFLSASSSAYRFFEFIGDATISLLISVLFAMVFLGLRKGENKAQIGKHLGDAVKDVASLFLVFAGAGALKQVLTDGGVSQTIADAMQGSSINPYVLGWLMAAIIRVCVGSSTVAGITAAGFIAPMLVAGSVNPNLMVLSIGAGSLMFSHVNDTGFWLFREYFQLSFKDTIRSWSIMDTLISVVGLLAVLALSYVV